MRRTNAAIESERNRIARDLHDGPVQGVSAASLSLEAVLLMLKAGEVTRASRCSRRSARELSEEADNLRRLMSGLRPAAARGARPDPGPPRDARQVRGRTTASRTEFAGARRPGSRRTSRRSPTGSSRRRCRTPASTPTPTASRSRSRRRRAAPDRGRRRRRRVRLAKAREYLRDGPGGARLDARARRARERHVHGALDARARAPRSSRRCRSTPYPRARELGQRSAPPSGRLGPSDRRPVAAWAVGVGVARRRRGAVVGAWGSAKGCRRVRGGRGRRARRGRRRRAARGPWCSR